MQHESAPVAHASSEFDAGPRLDIQLLRGVAVLAVVVYHAGLIPLHGGFLGVDMFFVISGYLITRNIVTAIDAGRFSFSEFYVRRARRLLPAAFCTLSATTLLAACVLTGSRWQDFLAQLWGALTFSANVVLPMQTGYFETAAHYKPLLHTWSLAVEEQYYLIAPAMLVLIRPQWRLPALAAMTALSLLLCVAMATAGLSHWRLPETDTRQLAFYMLPTRAWEMLAGSLLACGLLSRPPLRLPTPLAWASLCGLLAMFASPFDALHPRGDALVVVALTALLLASDGLWLGRSAPVRATARIGDWSYSLYLVHWPLFALAANAYLGVVPALVRAVLVLLALLLAWAQFRFVEQRFRHRRSSVRKAALAFGGGALAVAIAPLLAGMLRTEDGQRVSAQLAESTRGLSPRCAAGHGVNEPSACSTGAPATVALWGDSYAMHLVPGLLELPELSRNLIQITKAACAPIIDVASIDDQHDENWARGCLAFSRSALQRITSTPTIKHVILSSTFTGYLDDGPLKVYTPEGSVTASRTAALERFVDTVRRLQDAGKNVMLVAPPP